jgi:CBS domain-containing protein
MNIRDVMNPDTETVSPSTTLKDAAAIMAKKGIGFLLIGEDDQLKGTVTDRDIVLRAVAEGKNLESTTVGDVLTGELLYCKADQDVDQVAQNMSEKQVRRMPVVNEDKRLVGVVSIGDMAQALNKEEVGRILEGVTSEGRHAA